MNWLDPINIMLYPGALAIFYVVYIMMIPDNKNDKFFAFSRNTTFQESIRRIEYLESLHQANYEKERNQIIKFYEDDILTDKEIEKLEDIITNTYFDGFKIKWTAFTKAPPLLKIIFILSLIDGFYFFILMHQGNLGDHKTGMYFGTAAAISLIYTPAVYVMTLLIFGLYSLLLSFMTFILPRKGALARTRINTDELIKAMKPGGRDTRIVISNLASGKNWGNYF